MSARGGQRARSFIGIAAAAALALGAGGCAGALAPAFDSRFADNEAARTEALLQRLPPARARAHAGSLLVAASFGDQPALIAYDLGTGSLRWRVAVRADSRPELLGDLVLTTSGGRLLAFDARSGRARFSAATGACTYLGAARDTERVFFTCQAGAIDPRAPPNARLTALDARSGRVLWRREASGALGRPAAAFGLVFVPWQRQNLSVLDARSGRELQRLRSRDDVIDWVRADEGGVFFGERSIYRLGAHGYWGRRQDASFIRLPDAALPGDPAAMPSAFWPQPGGRSARGRIALYLQPEAVGPDGLRIARDRYYFVFYRYVFAFDAGGALRWARVLPRDSIAGQAVPAGLSLVLEDGSFELLAGEDGAARLKRALDVELASATLEAAGLQPAPAAAVAGEPLRRSLAEIALDGDNRLVPARAYAVARLAELDEPEVTRDLLDIYDQSSTPPELKRAVADALRTRRHGLGYLIDALGQRYDFLEQTRPAPLAVIVPPLIEAHETRALPRLVERMFDHETPIGVLPLVVRAVSTLGDDAVLAPLSGFLRLYRADSSFAADPQALLEAARGILAHGGERGPALLREIAGDGRASPALARGVAAILDRRAAASAPALATAEPAPEPKPALPDKLTQSQVNATFAEHADELRACIIDELGRNPKLGQVRIAFIAEADGSTHAFSFAPGSPQLQDCLYSKVAAYRFPRFRKGREVERYVIAVRAESPAPAQPGSPAQAGPAHFWDAAAARAQPERVTAGATPWWRSQQPLAAMASMVQGGEDAAGEAAGAGAGTTAGTGAKGGKRAAADDAWWVPVEPAPH